MPTPPPPPPRPKVLVLLAAYNGAQRIERQLLSILDQQGVDVRVVVGDDASLDDTVRRVLELGDRERIEVVRRPTGTGSGAQNFVGLVRDTDSSGFDYVALADQDDWWPEHRLERAIRCLEQSGASGYSSAVRARWPDGAERVILQSPRETRGDFLFEGGGQGCTYVMAQPFVARVRAIFQKHRDLAGELRYHDWAIYALARTLDLRWYFDSEPSVLYLQHEGNDIGARGSRASFQRRISLLRSGAYRRQADAVVRLCDSAAPGNAAVEFWRDVHRRSAPDRRLRLSWFAAAHGRRRRGDALLTAIAALLGWI